MAVDPDFLTMFTFPFIKGDVNTALNNPTDIVITQKLSKELFGAEDGMGKMVNLDNKYNFKVSAIMKDLPDNTQFDFEYLLPWLTCATLTKMIVHGTIILPIIIYCLNQILMLQR